MKKGTTVVELQNELRATGELQHLCTIAELDSWIVPMHKGESCIPLLKQVVALDNKIKK
jgi:hypothetical protein